MNIREHIEAGHYPKDEKGRALVPMRGGGAATVVCTDFGYEAIYAVPGGIGGPVLWNADGENWGPYRNCRTAELRAYDLLPPPPRKVQVTRYAAIHINGGACIDSAADWESLDHYRENPLCRVVKLTGEYEVSP